MTLPYGFVYPIYTNEDLFPGCGEYCIERVNMRIRADGLNPDDYFHCQYGWIPDQYRDSFSSQFVGQRLIFTIAHRRFDR